MTHPAFFLHTCNRISHWNPSFNGKTKSPKVWAGIAKSCYAVIVRQAHVCILFRKESCLQRHLSCSLWVTYASFNFTCYHPPWAYPWGFEIFFVLSSPFPTPGHEERDNSPPPSSWSTSDTFFEATSSWQQYSFRMANYNLSRVLYAIIKVYWHSILRYWKCSVGQNFLKPGGTVVL